jgi:hypothetical protein
MSYARACPVCQTTKVVRSRIHHVYEFLLLWLMEPYRCTLCGRRELKFRCIDMDNPADRAKGTRQIRHEQV